MICHLLAAEIQAPPSHCHWSAAHNADDDYHDNYDNYHDNYGDNHDDDEEDEDGESMILISIRMRE